MERLREIQRPPQRILLPTEPNCRADNGGGTDDDARRPERFAKRVNDGQRREGEQDPRPDG